MGKIFDALEKSIQGPQEPEKEEELRQVEEKTGLRRTAYLFAQLISPGPVVAQQDQIDENLVALLKPRSLEAEQFNILKTNILFPPSGKRPRSIMVTSAIPGEGKSFVAANLAISIALNIDEHALLVDCDFRNPSIHKRFGFDDVAGLADYLSQRATLGSVLLKTEVKKLTLLPAGRAIRNPSELLSSNQMSNLLRELTERYNDRYIIIDSPPPHLTAETNALARQVDGILLVVKYGRTPRNLVADLINILDKDKVLGVIMNWSDFRSAKYHLYGPYAKEKSG